LTWRIELLPSARAELLALDRPVQARILRSLHRLAAAPRSAANVKALKGNARYRLRVGDWRVIYTLLSKRSGRLKAQQSSQIRSAIARLRPVASTASTEENLV
jgi:mRNA interferase RelE/StbE